jgi:hypothetical protein
MSELLRSWRQLERSAGLARKRKAEARAALIAIGGNEALPSLLDYRDRTDLPVLIPHIHVIRQLVIIESFWWFARYNPCRNRVLSANGLPQKDVRLLRAIE